MTSVEAANSPADSTNRFAAFARQPGSRPAFPCAAFPNVPAFFLIACAGIFVNAFREEPRFTLINFAVLGAGLPLYWLWHGRQKSS